MTELSRCRACAQLVRWVYTMPRGNVMPLDPDQVPEGNFVFTQGGSVRALSHAELATPGDGRYRSHFATCKHAGVFRKGESQKAVARTRQAVDEANAEWRTANEGLKPRR